MSNYIRRSLAKQIFRCIKVSDQRPSSEGKDAVTSLAKAISVQANLTRKNIHEEPQFLVDYEKATSVLHEEELHKLKSLSVDALCEQNSVTSEDGPSIERIEQSTKFLKLRVFPKLFNQKVLNTVLQQGQKYGYKDVSNEDDKKTVLVEYSSPNIAKPFHAGHLRSTIIGNAIGNLYEVNGFKVVRINYLGDWGTQFGLLCHGYHKYGDENLMQADPMKHLYDVYVKINSAFKEEGQHKNIMFEDTETYKMGQKVFCDLEQGVSEDINLWKRFRDISIKEYKELYKRLNVEFDDYEGESQYQGQCHKLLDTLQEKGLLQENSKTGIRYININYNDIRDAVIQKSDGSTLYLTRDVAAILDRHEKYKFDKIHYVVEKGQFLHFMMLTGVLKKLEVPWIDEVAENLLISFGRLKGMSTRKGQVVFLKDILEAAKKGMLESMSETSTTKVDKDEMHKIADILGVSALIIHEFNQKRNNDLRFNWEQVKNSKSGPAVTLQYGHARLCSLLKDVSISEGDVDFDLLLEPEAQYLILELARYQDQIEKSFQDFEPHLLVQYLQRLVKASSVALGKFIVKDQEKSVADAYILLFYCTRTVLHNGLKVLGITPLEKM